MTLKDRCRKFLEELFSPLAPVDQREVDDLVAFVVAEIGRAAGDGQLENSLPLCLYFPTKQDREEFIAAVMEAKPNLVAKRLP
jgi:hypothetical protein